MDLAGRVREKRVEKGLSQVELAAAVGVTDRQISAIENGGGVSVELLTRLSETLGASLDWIVLGVDPLQSVTGRTFPRVTLDRLLDQLSDQDFEEFIAVARVKAARARSG